jgi:hypothetical protein
MYAAVICRSQASGLRLPLEFCHEVGLTTLGQPRLSEGAQPYQPKEPS